MPIIEMHLMEGRTTDQKRRVMAAVANAAAQALDMPLGNVRILITEHRADEFSVAGVSVAEKQESLPVSP
jgi:4-oxalocrotonate tautomerase